MDAKQLLAAIGELSETKGITNESVVSALKESLIRAYTKYLGGGDDADVICEIDLEQGKIKLGQNKTVVEEVQDDYLEIELEEANKGLKKAKYKVGDKFFIEASIDELKKATAMAVKSNLRMKIGEAERSALYENYKDKIGEMITGIVEKSDERSVTVNIGRTTVELNRRCMIGDETFKIGEPIKVYLEEVRTGIRPEGVPTEKKRGPQIEVTRSSEGFLKRLFEEEIHEIYEGTVLIKGIARLAGVRSKIAVSSLNDDIDPTGACIGTSGSRIQRIVSQLGNGKDKEKIDIISYSDNLGVLIIEAMRPATVLGVKLLEDTPEGKRQAIAVIKDNSMSLAIGRKMANIRLACKIANCTITLVEETQAAEQGIEFIPTEVWMKEAAAEKATKEKEAFLNKTIANAAKKAAELEAIKAAEAPQTGAGSESFPAEAANPALAALEVVRAEEAAKRAVEARAAERKAFTIPPVETAAPKAEEAVEEEVKEVVPTTVKTTTTLDELEKELESSKQIKTNPVKGKRPRKITEEEVSHVVPPADAVTPKTTQKAMAIYTEEELEAMEKEDELDPTLAESFEGDFEDDIDYEEYDEYYDQGK